jgi:hypothetical protein
MVTMKMFAARALTSRRAWLAYRRSPTPWAKARYERIVAYECRRNGTDTYTPYWLVSP